MTGHDAGEPGAQLADLAAAAAPGVCGPAACRRDVVLVTGPWLAGVSGVVTALTGRLPDRVFVEATDLAAGDAPAVVVFVVSAAAALTASDCALLDAAAGRTDAVIGAVSKIDLHPHWPQMLDLARDTLTARAPRYRAMAWVGAAAAPDLGEPRIDDLVDQICATFADEDLARRNELRELQFRIRAGIRRYDRDARAAGRSARSALLHEQRDATVRQRRLAKSERIIALRSRIAQARVQLSHFARNRCGSVRGELAEDAAGMTRRRLPEFTTYVRGRVDEVIADVDAGAAEHLADVAHRLGLADAFPAGAGARSQARPVVEVADPVLTSRRLETQLMMLLGAGFGLGVALTLSRIFAGLTAGPTAAGIAVCAVAGLAATVWVVSIRGLLRDRALLDRWVTEVVAALRGCAEELVALRVLSAESTLTAAVAERNEAESAQAADQVAAFDDELRAHAAATARAAALRDRELPALRRALSALRAELGECG